MPATCSDLMLGRLKAPSGGFRMRRGEPVTELRGALPMTIAEHMDESSRRTALGMSTIAMAACFLVWPVFSIVGVRVQSEFGLTQTQLGLLVGILLLPGAMSSQLAG